MARRVAAVGGRVRAVLWWQGERDARLLTPAPVYEAALQRLADAVWSDFGARLVVAQIGDYDEEFTEAGVDTVRQAQADAWTQPHIVQGPVFYDIDLHGEVHFLTREDVAAAAHRWAAAILTGVVHAAAPASRRVCCRRCATDDWIVLTADSELEADAGLGGFVVRADGQQVPVVSASADGDTVRLQLGEPVAGSLEVSLGEGRSAAGAVVSTDTSAWRLPMLPFRGAAGDHRHALTFSVARLERRAVGWRAEARRTVVESLRSQSLQLAGPARYGAGGRPGLMYGRAIERPPARKNNSMTSR